MPDAVALGMILAAAVTAGPRPAQAHGGGGTVVLTDEGLVRGVETPGVRKFLGIPYAAPPTGDRRWRPPAEAARWHGVRDASQLAPHCAQPASPFGAASTSEDCLYLNVFTPREGAARRDFLRGHPVMVWIHGGALLVGESDEYDPTRLVEQGGVIVVTINYRLGALGFMAHPALTAESADHASGNYGLMDQQAALGWVQRNIARFGGDPHRVTIFGESAGALSVHSQLASPRAAGLFQRAIVESGAYLLAPASLAVGEGRGSDLAARAGCADQTAACLRALSVATLLAVQGPSPSAQPVVDGLVLTQPIRTAFETGQFNRVPVIEGSNHDEWRLFVALNIELVAGPVTPEGYPAAIAATLGIPVAATAPFTAEYPLDEHPSPGEALSALGTDGVFACNARSAELLLSQHVPTYAYEFTDADAPQRFLPPVSFPYGAYHAAEIQYLFDIGSPIPADLDEDQQRLADAMVDYWTTFARTGQPSSPGRLPWPRLRADSERRLTLDTPARSIETDFAADHHCDFWAAPGQ
ncbi:MAG TPA: carboxylesterase/lipase family protein [Kofleriaceae bacterium]|nr:carboxylesterase/lipase family protein [Kofleriaceae bacterium]